MTHKMYLDKMQNKMVTTLQDIKDSSSVWIYQQLHRSGYTYIDELENINLDFIYDYVAVSAHMANNFVTYLSDLGVMISLNDEGFIVRYTNYEKGQSDLSFRYESKADAWKALQNKLANEIIAVNMKNYEKVEFLIDKNTQTASIKVNGYTKSEYKVVPFINSQAS